MPKHHKCQWCRIRPATQKSGVNLDTCNRCARLEAERQERQRQYDNEARWTPAGWEGGAW